MELRNGDFVWMYNSVGEVFYGVVVDGNIIEQMVFTMSISELNMDEDHKIGGICRSNRPIGFGHFKYFLLGGEIDDIEYIQATKSLEDYQEMVKNITLDTQEAMWALECIYNSENLSIKMN